MYLKNLKNFISKEYKIYAGTQDPQEALDFFKRCENYKSFLRKRLNIEMFYPVDSEGNLITREHARNPQNDIENQSEIFKIYVDSKDKILFKVEDSDFDIIKDKIKIYETINDLSERYTYELTDTALKLIKGL